MIVHKLYGLICSAICMMCVLTSCSDSDDSTPLEFIVSKSEMTFKKEGGTQKLAVKSTAGWTITSSATWCKPSVAGGDPGTKEFQVAVEENTDTDPREAILTVTSGGESKEVIVKQGYNDLLMVEKNTFALKADDEMVEVELSSSATPTITINDFWIAEAPHQSRAVSTQTLKFIISKNPALFERQGTITLAIGDLIETITITQQGVELNVPDNNAGMASDAKPLAAKMKLGWNLGNALEACSSSTSASETLWGNPKTNKAIVDMVKAAGFNAIRIPCAWSGYIVDEANYRIDDAWLARVKEVVDYCVDNEMYTILNIHWDGGWLENNATPDKQAEVNEKQKALWEQIAVYFRDYEEHLLFAGTNEVNSGEESTTKYYDVQMSYNQTFVDAVRSTGGRNAYRNLIVQSFSTDIDEADAHMEMSTDPTPNRLMVEVHYYPWHFCLLEEDINDTWGKAQYLWGDPYMEYANTIPGLEGRASTDNEDALRSQFDKIKTKFVDQGYPAILGEYGVVRRSSLTGDALKYHLESRAYFISCATKEAKNHGLVPFAWDNGGMNDMTMGIFDRKGLQVYDRQLLDAYVQGGNEGIYPF